jgi:hypothetical protein
MSSSAWRSSSMIGPRYKVLRLKSIAKEMPGPVKNAAKNAA